MVIFVNGLWMFAQIGIFMNAFKETEVEQGKSFALSYSAHFYIVAAKRKFIK